MLAENWLYRFLFFQFAFCILYISLKMKNISRFFLKSGTY